MAENRSSELPNQPSQSQVTQLLFPREIHKLSIYLDNLQNISKADGYKDQLIKFTDSINKLASTIKEPTIKILVKKLQEMLLPLIADKAPPPTHETIIRIKTHLEMLEETIEINFSRDTTSIETLSGTRHNIVICLQDEQLVEEILNQIKYFSYDCTNCPELKDLHNICKRQNPKFEAIILDADKCKESDSEELAIIAKKTPIIFVSTRDDVKIRLFAAKAGGQAFLPRPLEFTNLIEKIDNIITPSNESSPYRILIVEDSFTQANIIKEYLENVGMVTEIMVDPLKINDVLKDFQPDLILMDLYMPQFSGIDLAKVIRQQDPYVSIPIVFLSAEDDIDKQLQAMTLGGDDFLTKPISQNHLIASVSARAKRSKTLRREMIQDSLTGLLNHTRVLEELELEIARSRRNHNELCFAMIDIDHFKAVNDSHGHPVGDRVIKGLSRLLKQRLRKTDSVGRYGGEEFAIILPDSDGDAVLKKLDEIRRAFSKLLHQSVDQHVEFSATFSAGIAVFSNETASVDKLVQAADKALYLAKERGRNMVILGQ